MQSRVVACLGHRRKRGYLKSSPSPSDMLLWEVLPAPITGHEGGRAI